MATTPGRELGVEPSRMCVSLYRAIVFDWDGTAVIDRREDATALVSVAEALMQRGVWLVVVTGTKFDNIDRQFCRLVAPRLRRRLLICTNRGSEVYGFAARGQTVRRWLRVATPDEERALTAIAEGVRDAVVARTGLDVYIVYDRLNRRKIDLIPEPEWADPPKAQIGALFSAVEARLRGAGLAGGLSEVVALARRLAQEQGLPQARLTSDVKHVEIGLTDKADSMDWIERHLLRRLRIRPDAVLIAGDEFGAIAGFPGSDDRLRSGIEGAPVISVGAEPNGTPKGVVHIGGGPARFRALLAEQVWGWEQPARAPSTTPAAIVPAPLQRAAHEAVAAPSTPDWVLEQGEYNPALERDVESRLTTSNGLLGSRGSAELPLPGSLPRTFVAGIYDEQDGPAHIPALAAAPTWLRLHLSVDGEVIDLGGPQLNFEYTRRLDLARGIVQGCWRIPMAGGGELRLETFRFASLAERRLTVQGLAIRVDRPAVLTVAPLIEPPESGVAKVCEEDTLSLWQTNHTGLRLAVAQAVSLTVGAKRVLPRPDATGARCWSWVALPGQTAILQRFTAVARGDTSDTDDVMARASGTLRSAARKGLQRLLSAQARTWQQRLLASDVTVEGDDQSQAALRFATYHLVSAADPDDDRVSIGARGLTGDAYLGHVFWDTEIFQLPFYIYTWTAVARALLLYRFHTLPAARAKAARLGYRGALYAWESAGTGEEATPELAVGPDGRVIPIRCGTEEQHISADVAYAVWQYWQATRDVRFLLDAGAEMLLETARFWASRATESADGRFHIDHVIGPDEYHEGVDDNAYTNGMARWNLERGLETAAFLQRRHPHRWAELRGRLGITAAELGVWRNVAARMEPGRGDHEGVFEQFKGFFDLKQVDLASYASRTVPMDVLLGPEQIARSQVIKQADVLMLLALLWERYPARVREANERYYEPRCGHGSSLSPGVHALVLARLGETEAALRYFHQAAAIDLSEAAGTAALGVHMAALGGLWQAVVFGFAGVRFSERGLVLDPHLPAAWRRLRFPLRWRDRSLGIDLTAQPLRAAVTLHSGRPLTVQAGPRVAVVKRGERVVFDGGVLVAGKEVVL